LRYRCVHDAKRTGNIPIIPPALDNAGAHREHAHDRNRRRLPSWRKLAERTGVPETKAQPDRDAVFDAKDVFDGKMKLAERGQERFRCGAKGVASAECRIRAGEVIGYGVRRQQLINRFEPALVP
jgi:hypothetical protein